MDIFRSVIKLALGCLPPLPIRQLPSIIFQSYSANDAYPEVPIEEQSAARFIVETAYFWCRDLFPVRMPLEVDGRYRYAIDVLEIRMTLKSEMLSASSPDTPGHIILGASWPIENYYRYRLSSLIAHEILHQNLFVREEIHSPVRNGSLGYSPWRYTSRPGHLVWHAFWTFACEFSLLAEAITKCSSILQEDTALIDYIAPMLPRLKICIDSLQMFEIVTPDELTRCSHAIHIIKLLSERLAHIPSYTAKVDSEELVATKVYQSWAESILKFKKDISSSDKAFLDIWNRQ